MNATETTGSLVGWFVRSTPCDRCGRRLREIAGFGVAAPGFYDVVCRCGERWCMRPEVAEQLARGGVR
jgi:hypothetical protein